MCMARTLVVLAGLLAAFPSLSGCGNQSGPDRQPVSGSVTFEGGPLDQGTIQFTPTGTSGIGSGAAISDGRYTIPQDKGLPPGQYRVMIFSAKLDADASEMAVVGPPGSAELMPERIPPEYNALSEITVEVRSGEDNQFDFTIE